MDDYRDTTLHNADGTEDALRADMNDNTAPDTGSVCYGKNRRRRSIAIASVIAAVVVFAGGYAYVASNVQKGADAAQANAQAVDQKLTTRIGEAQELLDGTEEGQVSDAQTLTALSDAIDKAQAQTGVDSIGANRWLVWEKMDAQAAYDADAKDAEDAMGRLDDAMDAVTGSVDAKTLADAKAALQSAVDSADKTYTDSDGKVRDNVTRDGLKAALDAAKKVLDDDSVTDAKEYTDQKTAVDNAVKTVNDSITAKEKADAEAKAEAEAAASSSGSSGDGSYYGGGYTGGSTGYSSAPSYSGNTGSSNNGYTAPNNSSSTGSGSYHGGDTDSVGGVWTPLEGDSWDYSLDIFN